MEEQHDLYVNNLIGDIKVNPGDFCRYVNSQKKDTSKEEKWQWFGSQSWNRQMNLTVSLQICPPRVKMNTPKSPLRKRSASFMEGIHVSAKGVTKLLRV